MHGVPVRIDIKVNPFVYCAYQAGSAIYQASSAVNARLDEGKYVPFLSEIQGVYFTVLGGTSVIVSAAQLVDDRLRGTTTYDAMGFSTSTQLKLGALIMIGGSVNALAVPTILYLGYKLLT